MIRKLTPEDLDAVMHIWLSANLEAHAFVPAAYWHGHFEQVRAVLPTAAVYVHEEQAGHVDGFIGLFGDDIAGLLVEQAARPKGCLLYTSWRRFPARPTRRMPVRAPRWKRRRPTACVLWCRRLLTPRGRRAGIIWASAIL